MNIKKYLLPAAILLPLLLVVLKPTSHPLEKSIVKILNFDSTGGGTGFSVRSHGKSVIITNAHVCDIARNNFIVVEQEGGKRSIKKVLERNAARDLCMVDGVDVPTLTVGKKQPNRFDPLSAIGHPFLNPTTRSYGEYVADGIVPLGKPMDKDGGCKDGHIADSMFGQFCVIDIELSFTTVPIYPGNSGSPVLNADGEVVGVYSAAGPDHRGLFVPLPYLKEILEK